MRSALILGLALVGFYGVCNYCANARPQKVDYSSGICQKMAVLTGTGGTGVSLVYSDPEVYPVGGDITMLCPLEHVTFDADTGSGGASGTVQVTVKAKVSSNFALPSVCEVRSENGGFSSISLALNTAGTMIVGSYNEPLPIAGASDPTALRLVCKYLKSTHRIGSMQVQLGP